MEDLNQFPLFEFGALRQDATETVLISGHRKLYQPRLPEKHDVLQVYLNQEDDVASLVKVKSLCPARYQKKNDEVWVNLSFSGESKASLSLKCKLGQPDWSIIKNDQIGRSGNAKISKLAGMTILSLCILLCCSHVESSSVVRSHEVSRKSNTGSHAAYLSNTLVTQNNKSQKLGNTGYHSYRTKLLTYTFGPGWYQQGSPTEIGPINLMLY